MILFKRGKDGIYRELVDFETDSRLDKVKIEVVVHGREYIEEVTALVLGEGKLAIVPEDEFQKAI